MTIEKENDDPDTGNDDFFNDPNTGNDPDTGNDSDTGNDPDTGNDEFFNDLSDTGSWYAASTSELFSEGEEERDEIENIDDVLEENSDMEVDDILGCIGHPHGGYVYPDWTPEDENVAADDNYYPWQNDTELWLCDLLFRRGQVSTVVADEILGAITSGKLSSKEPI